jgi:hypothetical protein
MDALCISKNGIQQLSVELIPSAGLGIDLGWYGDAKQGIAIHVTRTDELAQQGRWKDLHVLVGDRISFVTREVDSVDEPIEFLTDEDLINQARTKPKMRSEKRVRTPLRKLGVLDYQINSKPLFSFHLTTDNMLSVGFVWLGNRTGMSLMHIGSEVSPKPIIPTIAFGDEVTIHWR